MADSSSPPVALTIAGSDNSAGAGIQADLKTFSSFAVYGLTSVTCVVAEVPGKVSAIQPVDVDVIVRQIELSLTAFPVAVVKTGMLYSREIIEAVGRLLQPHAARCGGSLQIVVDPVMMASSGDALLQNDAVDAYREFLFPLATVVTPNLDEASCLLGQPITTLTAMRDVGDALRQTLQADLLLKGGHLKTDTATDILFCNDRTYDFSAPFRREVSTHGTGCTYAAAIAANLAHSRPLPEAVRRAKKFVTTAIQQLHIWQTASGSTMALNHTLPTSNF